MDNQHIGYIPLNEKGEPHRAPRSGYSFQSRQEKGFHPPRVYSTVRRAQAYSPVGKAAEVRMVTTDV